MTVGLPEGPRYPRYSPFTEIRSASRPASVVNRQCSWLKHPFTKSLISYPRVAASSRWFVPALKLAFALMLPNGGDLLTNWSTLKLKLLRLDFVFE